MLLSKIQKIIARSKTSHQQRNDQTRLLYRCFDILNVYFWIHGLVLPMAHKSNIKRCIEIAISILLAIIFEGNVIYNLFTRHQCLFDNDMQVKNYIIVINYLSLTIMDRYIMCSSSIKLFKTFTRSLKLCIRIPGTLTDKIKIQLLIILIITDSLSALALFHIFQTPPALENDDEVTRSISYDSILPNVSFFFLIWKNIGICIAFYFGIICYILKEALLRIGTMVKHPDVKTDCLIGLLNEVQDIVKEVNDIFCNMIVITFIISIGGVFFHLYNIFFNSILCFHMYRYNSVIRYSMPFLLICFMASSVSNAASNVKYSIEKLRLEDFQNKPFLNVAMNKCLFRFTILDSVVIDKSLIFSAGGILLSYGTLIATFTISSKQQ